MRGDSGHGGHTQETDADNLSERVRPQGGSVRYGAYSGGDSGVQGDATAARAASTFLLNLIRVLQHVATGLEALLGDFAAFRPDRG